jgi:hypothetical protein
MSRADDDIRRDRMPAQNDADRSIAARDVNDETSLPENATTLEKHDHELLKKHRRGLLIARVEMQLRELGPGTPDEDSDFYALTVGPGRKRTDNEACLEMILARGGRPIDQLIQDEDTSRATAFLKAPPLANPRDAEILRLKTGADLTEKEMAEQVGLSRFKLRRRWERIVEECRRLLYPDLVQKSPQRRIASFTTCSKDAEWGNGAPVRPCTCDNCDRPPTIVMRPTLRRAA